MSSNQRDTLGFVSEARAKSKQQLVSRVAEAIRTNKVTPELIQEIRGLDNSQEIVKAAQLQVAANSHQVGQCNDHTPFQPSYVQ